jgi:hypothetical protein
MAKMIAPPQIGGLMELMDLVTDPNKFQSYVKQLQDYDAAIKERLGLLTTKDEADEYLNKAKALESDAQAKLISVMKREEEFTAMRNQWRDNLAKAKELLGV